MTTFVTWVKGHRWESLSALLGLLLVTTLTVMIVGSEDPVPSAAADTTTTSTAPSTTSAPTTTQGEDPAPATTVPTVEESSGVVAVVVDNVADVGFQIGIGASDLLIETPVEGGITRFTALFGEEVPDLVGPVRSLRPVSADLLALFRPIVFSTGGQPFVTGAVTATGTSVVTPAESVAFQSLERPQPHHLFVSPGVDVAGGVPLELPWSTGEWPGGESANEVTLPIAEGAMWRFEDGAYVRYRQGEPQLVQSGIDDEALPLMRDTLVVMVANRKSAGYTDSAGFDVPTFDVIGGGDVYLLHNGEVIVGSWFRPGQAARYEFSDIDGDPVEIPAGDVYWAIVPDGEPIDLGG
jgi:hypothetical protein